MKFFKSPWFILLLTAIVAVPLTACNILDTFYFAHASGKKGEDDYSFDNTPTPTSPTYTVYDHTSVEYTAGKSLIEGSEVPYHLLEFKLKSLTNLRSRVAVNEEGEYGQNITQKMEDMVKDAKEESGKDVLGAISGDFSISWSNHRNGYAVRNGTVYKTDRRGGSNPIDLVFKKDKTVELLSERDYQMDAFPGEISEKYYQIFAFGPVLVDNYEIAIEEDAEINGNTWVNNQRAAVGVIDWNHFFFLGTEAISRSPDPPLRSFKLHELAKLFKELGCKYAYNLDGGYSSGAAYNNEVVFKPNRSIGDIFYVISD